jgi:hypothetical protein
VEDDMTDPAIHPTRNTRVGRHPERASYDRSVIHAILDEGLVAHVGFVVHGRPVVLPMGYGRLGDRLILHGSAVSRMLRTLTDGVEACVTVTLLDGLVLARSAFHHSVNYRSVVVLGRAHAVDDDAEKEVALTAIVEKVLRGRSAACRPPSEAELRATHVVWLPLDEASAKVRSGPPIDAEEDYALPHWAGVIPLRVAAGEPEPDPRLDARTRYPHARG